MRKTPIWLWAAKRFLAAYPIMRHSALILPDLDNTCEFEGSRARSNAPIPESCPRLSEKLLAWMVAALKEPGNLSGEPSALPHSLKFLGCGGGR
jgi:hypothetical protein